MAVDMEMSLTEDNKAAALVIKTTGMKEGISIKLGEGELSIFMDSCELALHAIKRFARDKIIDKAVNSSNVIQFPKLKKLKENIS